MHENIKELFHLTRRERNGSIVLITLIILGIVFNYILPHLIHTESKFNNINLAALSGKSFRDSTGTDEGNIDYSDHITDRKQSAERSLFIFNPNTLNHEGFRKLGLSDKQIKSIIKYRERGGVFRQKSDFSKMYVISEREYKLLLPYIGLPENPDEQGNRDKVEAETEIVSQTSKKYSESASKRKSWKIELNSADTTDLKGLRGFGSFTAKKIVEYRRNLGGFLTVDQLLEVWPIKPELLDSVREFILIDPGLVEKININTVELERLKKHPYLTLPQAKSLIAYRNKHGLFLQIDDIKKSVLIDEITFGRLKPYLTI